MAQARKLANAVGERRSPARQKADHRLADDAAPLPTPQVVTLLDARGLLAADAVADALGMSKSQLAETVGLGREALYKSSRIGSPKTQSRLREMLEIVGRVEEWAGGKHQAMAWYRAQPIPAFGGRTAEALVKTGQAGAVRDYLDHIALGGFA